MRTRLFRTVSLKGPFSTIGGQIESKEKREGRRERAANAMPKPISRHVRTLLESTLNVAKNRYSVFFVKGIFK